jgi:hypothetical protein
MNAVVTTQFLVMFTVAGWKTFLESQGKSRIEVTLPKMLPGFTWAFLFTGEETGW